MQSIDIYQSNGYDRLRSLEQQRADLLVKIAENNFADPKIKELYDQALASLDTKVNALAGGEVLQDDLAQIGHTALLGTEQLAPLEGLLATDEIDSLRASYTAEVASVMQHFNVYGAQTPEAQLLASKVSASSIAMRLPHETEAELTPPAASEAEEKSKRHVTITIGEKNVRVGRQGAFYNFSSRTHEGQEDYTLPRKRALLYLLTHGDQEIRAEELWAEVGNCEFGQLSSKHQHAVRDWLLNITHNKTPLVIFNQKRGAGSAYQLNQQFDVELKFAKSLQAISRPGIKIDLPEAQESAEEDEIDAEPKFLGDLWFTANHLADFNDLLEAAGIGQITENMIGQLSPHRPNLSYLKGANEAIYAYRKAAIQRVKDFLTDENRFFEWIETADGQTEGYELIDKLTQLSTTQNKFLDRLFGASAKVESNIARGQILGVGVVFYDEFETPITVEDAARAHPDYIEPAPKPTIVQRPAIQSALEELLEEGLLPGEDAVRLPIELPEDEVVIIEREDENAGKTSTDVKEPIDRKTKQAQKHEQLLSDIKDFIGQFVSDFKGGIGEEHTYAAPQLKEIVPSGFKPTFTPTKLRLRGGDKIGTRTWASNHKFSMDETLEIAVSKQFGIPKLSKELSGLVKSELARLREERQKQTQK